MEQGSSSKSALISLIKTIVGAGILSMPYAFAKNGIVFGIFMIAIAAISSWYGLFLQGYVSRYVPVGHATFFNICSITYPSLSVVFDIAIMVQCIGCAISYLVLTGELMSSIIPGANFIESISDKAFWIICSSFVCMPLSFIKNLDSLKYTSVLGLASLLYMSVLVVGHYVVGDIPESSKGEVVLFPKNVSGVLGTFSLMVFAFTGHQNMFSIINEVEDKSLINLSRILAKGILISAVFLTSVGLAGYGTFGDKVSGNIILQYLNSWTSVLGRLSIACMVIFSFPLMFHPARISAGNIYYYIKNIISPPMEESTTDERSPLIYGSQQNPVSALKSVHVIVMPTKVYMIITSLMLAFAYVMALSVSSFAFVLSIVGATGSTSISFILPGLFGSSLIGTEQIEVSRIAKIFKKLSSILVVWGICVMLLCLYSTLFLGS